MLKQIARGVLVFAFLILVGSWIVVILVDSFNIMSLGDRLIEQTPSNSSAFVILFGEGRPVEWAQWFSLMTACIVTAYISAIEHTRGNTTRHAFFTLFACLFAIMVIEDAGNIRLTLIHIYAGFGIHSELGRSIPMMWYAIIALIPIVAIAKYGRKFIVADKIWGFFAVGFIFYAIAAGGSAVWLGYYQSIGDLLNNILFGGRIIYEEPRAGYWIMDYLVEETIELFGSLSFLLFSYSYYTNNCLNDENSV